MGIKRETLYRFPWSKTDNSGGWVEVTDECDLTCLGCYRHKLGGHRPLDEVKKDVLDCRWITKCDAMAIAGGEPLLYPHIIEVIEFMSQNNIKPVLLTNGEKLSREYAERLKKAGLAKIHFHIDSGQDRPGWRGKSEREMNSLRQHYADLLWDLGNIQCGYNVTIYRSNLHELPVIVNWCRSNIQKVQHISLIAFRSIPLNTGIDYWAGGRPLDLSGIQNCSSNLDEISITTEDMYGILEDRYPDLKPCAYLNGTSAPETYKYLIAVHVGSKKNIYGVLGAKTVELTQIFYHLFKGRYCAFLRSPRAGKKLFLLSGFDKEVRKTLKKYLGAVLRDPLRIFDRIYVQSIHLQQPNEILEGRVNLCDGCANHMVYQGKLINSCRLDEFRMYGAPIQPIPSPDSREKSQ